LADAGLGLNPKVPQKKTISVFIGKVAKKKKEKNLKRNIFSK
jgi:hypothetical protein